MGFLDKIFRRSPPPPPACLPRPKSVSGLDDNSRCIIVQLENNNVLMMDRDSYDYMYVESNAPDPSQADLDQLLAEFSRVRVTAGGMSQGRAVGHEVIVDTEDPETLDSLRKTLRIVEDPQTFAHCNCEGGPTLELYRGPELVATISLQHGHSIRWQKWKHDAPLCDGSLLNDWLRKSGVDPEFLEILLHNGYDSMGMLPLGYQRSGTEPLSIAEQQVRIADLARVRDGDAAQALARVEKIIDEQPHVALAYAVRAQFRRQSGDLAGCLADCNTAIRLDLPEAGLFFLRAMTLDGLGHPEEALVDCERVLKIDPMHFGAMHSRALIRGHLVQNADALADLDELIRLAPNWALPYLTRGTVHGRCADLDSAIADFSRVIDLVGKSPSDDDRQIAWKAYWNRGQSFAGQGDEVRARADYLEAVLRNPALAGAPEPGGDSPPAAGDE